MAVDKLTINDPRVEHHTTTVNGRKYHYIVGNPTSGAPVDTILLVHGWPDLGHGWRYQVPFLVSLGYRVIVPDMLGYGQTDAPQALGEYSHKSLAGDLVALAAHVIGEDQPFILGGHDWGGSVVWRTTLWYPQTIKAVFSICTPYAAPLPVWIEDERYVTIVPSFKYQLQLAGPDVEANVVGKDKLRGFLNGMYYGRGPNGERSFTTEKGVLLENLDKIGPSPLVSKEEIDYYVDQYAIHGMRGPLNWYRTRKINWEEEQELLLQPGRTRITAPSLMVVAKRDAALPPQLAAKMPQSFDNLTMKEVDATHWALWEAAAEVNNHLEQFLNSVVKGSGPKAAI
ncbi:epoxide hydrolase [Thozetella sp. PMI_491]|nr:epoxide hydrolase [Thozetella sp. PMI_491]